MFSLQLQSFRVLAIWVLLFAWLFCGGVALAEQLELSVESSEQESTTCEAALASLEQALKPHVDDSRSATSPDLFSFLVYDHFLTSFGGLHDGSAVCHTRWPQLLVPIFSDLTQLLCTYRI